MKIITKQVNIIKTLDSDEIEKHLSIQGELIRWAAVRADKENFLIEAVFIE